MSECNFDYCFYLDPEIVEKIFAARHLDSIHHAAMIALYTLDAQGLFDDRVFQILPDDSGQLSHQIIDPNPYIQSAYVKPPWLSF